MSRREPYASITPVQASYCESAPAWIETGFVRAGIVTVFSRGCLCCVPQVNRIVASGQCAVQPKLQKLEERVVLSTFRVNTTLDTVA